MGRVWKAVRSWRASWRRWSEGSELVLPHIPTAVLTLQTAVNFRQCIECAQAVHTLLRAH